MQHVDYMEVAPKAMKQITGSGAFLVVKDGTRLNAMTIGWATIGLAWGKPVMMVMVRPSRHTYGIIEKAADFSVSIPLGGNMASELAYCGSKSGRDFDKFKECGLKPAACSKIACPRIALSGLHYECRIIQATAMNSQRADKSILNCYQNSDFHTLYFGEIVDCYETT
jgi:flavin reductase (DIM6/NTAB) family NADH-FMN oxidoreductase RutF